MKRMLILTICAAASSGFAISVPGTANIWGSGYGDAPNPGGGGGGTTPPFFSIALGTQYVEVSAAGLTNPFGGTPSIGPDGQGGNTGINGFRELSGMNAPRQGMLVGVFLDNGVPGSAPSTLDFHSIGTTFTDLSPQLGQLFYVGDGLTGEGSGAMQKFHAPTGATRLFFGFADAAGFGGNAGFYHDNTGELEVTINAVPEPASLAALGIGLAALARRRRR